MKKNHKKKLFGKYGTGAVSNHFKSKQIRGMTQITFETILSKSNSAGFLLGDGVNTILLMATRNPANSPVEVGSCFPFFPQVLAPSAGGGSPDF